MYIMVDVETMGVNSNAALLSIGAVSFDIKIQDEFYRTIDLQSSMLNGGIVDAGIIKWWMNQSDAARKEAMRGELTELLVLEGFAHWLNKQSYEAIWSNGCDFDLVILRNAYKRYGLTAPWSYNKLRCFRTMRAMFAPMPFKPKGLAHKSIDDATNQAEYLMALLDKMNKG